MEERNRVYREALKYFRYGDFLCITIEKVNRLIYGKYIRVDEINFPELFLFKEPDLGDKDAWLSREGTNLNSFEIHGNELRKCVLEFYIAMTE